MNYHDHATQLRIICKGTRDDIVAWLKWNDPNGTYTDEDSAAEGIDPIGYDSARDTMIRHVLTDATVRLYGFPGTYPLEIHQGRPYATRNGQLLFPVSLASIVELNGQPTPLRSCPLVPPASDYPHKPMFEYDDGPQEYCLPYLK